MKLYSSKFQELSLENDIFIQKWTSLSGKMTEEEFQKEMIIFRDTLLAENKKINVLIDMSDFEFLVGPEIQNWVNEEINTKIAEVNEKTAFIVSSDLFTKISVEQTLEEDKHLKKMYFTDKKEALEWLKS